MSARSAAQHTPAELQFLSADDLTAIVAFTAPSASQPDRTNTVSYDTATGATLCDCRGAECGRACWHADLAPVAWQRHPAARDVRWLTDARLVAYGRKVAAMVTTYRARAGRVLPADATNLIAARWEYRRRAADELRDSSGTAAPAPRAAPPPVPIGTMPRAA